MFKEIDVRALNENPVEMIDGRWLLLTAGDRNGYNMMTASWGMLGELWNKDVATVFVRPQRYTYTFMEAQPYFTVAVLPDSMKQAVHGICGSQSGRDIDKTAATGLTPVFDPHCVYFEQAEIVLVCRKLYADDLRPEKFVDTAIIDQCYRGDFHRVYVGEIEKVLVKA